MTQKINKELHEALGKCIHSFAQMEGSNLSECGKCGMVIHINKPRIPDYCADPRLVIKAMSTREDFDQFLQECSLRHGWRVIYLIMDKTGRLARLALEWLEGGRG